MVLVEIPCDLVSLEPPQAGLVRFTDVAARCAARVHVVAGRAAELGRDPDRAATVGNELPKNFLRAAGGVRVGAVEEVDACVAAAMKHRRRGSRVGVAAE